VPDNRKVLERLHWQIRELADACADPRASARLSEIAGMIASNIKPTDEDLNLVREAIASSSVQSEETVLPEEVELDEFLNKFSPEAIFAEDPANTDYGDNADITENYDRLKTLKKLIADIERKEKQLPPGISAERKKLAVAKEKLAKEHHRLFVSQFGDSLAEEDHGEPTKDDIIWCSNCGERFHGNGRKHGFSHCENHKGFKMIYETLVTDDENVDEGDAYGVAQKDRERKEEIVYNKEQRAKRWNFGEPIKDDTAADSDLEEDTADENINEGWSIAKPIDTDRYQSRAGLEGPFMTKVGKVVYYDPKEGKYYDPDSDFYIDYDDYAAMNEESSVGSDNPCHVCDGSGTHRGKTCRLCDGSGLSSAGHHSVEEAESDIRFIPGVPGEAILKIGNYYLVWDRDRYESRTVKNEYDVYQQTGDTFKHIENLNMPYDPPGHATAMFIKKYSHMTESENIKRIKHLAGI